MGVVYTPDSEYAKEAVKWEGHHSQFGPPGRPYQHREYPKRLYKAKDAQGREFESVEVGSEVEATNMESRGFRCGQDKAVEALLAQQTEVAEQAANRAFHEQYMSEKARAEAQAYDDSTPNHVPVIPEKPRRRKPGPKPKGQTDADVQA